MWIFAIYAFLGVVLLSRSLVYKYCGEGHWYVALVDSTGARLMVGVQWLFSHWEWLYVLATVACIGLMLNDPGTAIFFYCFGFLSVIPPFALLPAFIFLVYPVFFTFGLATMRVQVYVRQLGWTLYLAFVGLFIGMHPTGDTLEEIIALRLLEVQQDFWPAIIVYSLMLLAPPIPLFFWTRHARLNPELTSWDKDMPKPLAELEEESPEEDKA